MHFEDAQGFHTWPAKAVTLMGMSGVGKTTLANRIPKQTWFHYSVDYRIGTKYMAEPILDEIKRHAMKDPFLAELLKSDSIYIGSNLTVDNLTLISSFLGKLGNPERGGLTLPEFQCRQQLHRDAEVGALRDVVEFIRRARDIYGYPNFLNDAGGSICEIDDRATLELLSEHTLILYIRSDAALEQELIRRAEAHPKPLYYQRAFLETGLADYMAIHGVNNVAQVDPDAFARWLFPRLVAHRLPRYQAIANRYGYTVDYHDAATVRDEHDFLALIADAIKHARAG